MSSDPLVNEIITSMADEDDPVDIRLKRERLTPGYYKNADSEDDEQLTSSETYGFEE